jgi:hypothetical protein
VSCVAVLMKETVSHSAVQSRDTSTFLDWCVLVQNQDLQNKHLLSKLKQFEPKK